MIGLEPSVWPGGAGCFNLGDANSGHPSPFDRQNIPGFLERGASNLAADDDEQICIPHVLKNMGHPAETVAAWAPIGLVRGGDSG